MPGHPLPYSAFPDINPAGAPQGDFENINASPDMFGGLIAKGTEKLGSGVEDASTAGTNIAIQQYGMLNETLATNAETNYMADLGKLTAQYKSNEGLAAVSAQPQYQNDVATLRQQYLKTLPSFAAQRAFNLLALRHEGYALQDSSSYSASQLKHADLQSANASSGAAISAAGSLDVAQNDRRFQDQLHAIDFATRRAMQNQGWAEYMHEDGATHALTFDDTPQGQQAKAVYEDTHGKAVAMAYQNRFHVLADQNVVSAYNLYQKERGSIPGSAQTELDAYFTPKIRDAQTRDIQNATINNADAAYTKGEGRAAVANPDIPKEAVPLLQQIGATESSNHYNVRYGGQTFNDFSDHPNIAAPISSGPDVGKTSTAAGYYQFLNSTWQTEKQKLGLTDFSPANQDAAAWDLAQTEYKAKTGNDLLTDLKGGKSIDSILPSLSGQWSSLPGGRQPARYVGGLPGQVQSKADFYRVNYASILDDTRTQAQALHPDDPTFINLAVARTEQELSKTIQQQDLSNRADTDLVAQAFNGDLSNNKGRPTTVDQLVAISPQVKAAWQRMQVNNPLAASHIEARILTANAKENGKDLQTYGTGFYDLFRRIHAPEGDPQRITDPTQLYGHVGENGDLTVAGVDKLTSEIQARRSPEGVAESEMKAQFLKNARSQITGKSEHLGFVDHKGDELYLKFLADFFPAYEAARRQGKPAAQILNPDSPEYLGKTINNFKRPQTEWFSDVIKDNPELAPDGTTPAKSAQPFDIKTVKALPDLVAAYRAGKVSKQAADEMAITKGWGMRKPPVAARPEVPLSQ